MTGVVAMFLSAAAAFVGITFLCWRARKAGYEEGFERGMDYAEEALLDEDEAVARLCRTLDTDRAGLRKVIRQADRNAHSSVLPDMRRHREEVN
jgi:hypothetical protein